MLRRNKASKCLQTTIGGKKAHKSTEQTQSDWWRVPQKEEMKLLNVAHRGSPRQGGGCLYIQKGDFWTKGKGHFLECHKAIRWRTRAFQCKKQNIPMNVVKQQTRSCVFLPAPFTVMWENQFLYFWRQSFHHLFSSNPGHIYKICPHVTLPDKLFDDQGMAQIFLGIPTSAKFWRQKL